MIKAAKQHTAHIDSIKNLCELCRLKGHSLTLTSDNTEKKRKEKLQRRLTTTTMTTVNCPFEGGKEEKST